MAKQNTQKTQKSPTKNSDLDSIKPEDNTNCKLDTIIELIKELIAKVDKDKSITADMLFPPDK